MTQTIERTALGQLLSNEDYARKVMPHMKMDYFSDKTERTVFEEIQKFVHRYNALPTKDTLEIEIDTRRDLNEDDIKRVLTVVKELSVDDNVNADWLVETTEKFCKDRAVYNAIHFEFNGRGVNICRKRLDCSKPSTLKEPYGNSSPTRSPTS